jgi:hypothetical protein
MEVVTTVMVATPMMELLVLFDYHRDIRLIPLVMFDWYCSTRVYTFLLENYGQVSNLNVCI